MKAKYLFLDDAATTEDKTGEKIDVLVDNVAEENDDLEIEVVYPSPFDDQISLLNELNLDGLILDLRLDEFAPPTTEEDEGQEKPNYRATALAQEIRTRSTERQRGLGEFPIVLWSYKHKLEKSYTKDDTGHDLFDLKCKKEKLLDPEEADTIGKKLVALAQGYKTILETRSRKTGPGTQFHKFLGLDEKPGFLDPRILSYFEGRETQLPAHEYARFILRELLDIPGPLISEEVLAARLGVDIDGSKHWNALKRRIPEEARYSGPFHNGWPRWWAHRVEQWWKGLEDCPGSLKRLEAEERVTFLRSATRLTRIFPAEPIEAEYSTQYWTVCQADDSPRAPLDPRDAFIVDRKDKQPWQEELYISKKAALEGLGHEKGLRVDPLERERLKDLKKRREEQLRRG